MQDPRLSAPLLLSLHLLLHLLSTIVPSAPGSSVLFMALIRLSPYKNQQVDSKFLSQQVPISLQLTLHPQLLLYQIFPSTGPNSNASNGHYQCLTLVGASSLLNSFPDKPDYGKNISTSFPMLRGCVENSNIVQLAFPCFYLFRLKYSNSSIRIS